MKRILVVILSILMVIFITEKSRADVSIDVASMGIEELISLRMALDEEIDKRLNNFGYSNYSIEFREAMIGAGWYLTGEDIPAGKYEVLCVFTQGNTDTSDRAVLWVDTYDEIEDKYELNWTYANICVGQQIMIQLEDNDYLAIERGNFMIRPFVEVLAPKIE